MSMLALSGLGRKPSARFQLSAKLKDLASYFLTPHQRPWLPPAHAFDARTSGAIRLLGEKSASLHAKAYPTDNPVWSQTARERTSRNPGNLQ